MRSKHNANKPPRGVLVFERSKDHDYIWQSMPTRYDLFASYLFESEVKARWRAIDAPFNTEPAALLSKKYGLAYVPIGSESDCSNMRIATILDEASGKSFEIFYFGDSTLFEMRRNNNDLYDVETTYASINDADGIIRDKKNEAFWKNHPDALD